MWNCSVGSIKSGCGEVELWLTTAFCPSVSWHGYILLLKSFIVQFWLNSHCSVVLNSIQDLPVLMTHEESCDGKHRLFNLLWMCFRFSLILNSYNSAPLLTPSPLQLKFMQLVFEKKERSRRCHRGKKLKKSLSLWPVREWLNWIEWPLKVKLFNLWTLQCRFKGSLSCPIGQTAFCIAHPWKCTVIQKAVTYHEHL